MHHLREKTLLFQDQSRWLAIAKRWSFSEPCKGSIKQTNTSQVLVSETVPDRRVQLSRQAKKTRVEDNPVTSPDVTPLLETGGNSNWM